jgi:indole-3-glycerol phosphate synthase
MNVLEPILASTRRELRRRTREVPLAALEALGSKRVDAGDRRPFAQAIRSPGLALIAEHKRRSPSAGAIREGTALGTVVKAYEQGGAAALSILTEGSSFGGSLDDLRAARGGATLPILRKDFVVDPYQIAESWAFGADAILLIVAALEDRELLDLHERAIELGLAALVEVHDEQELDRASSAGAQLIGINNRDLRTLEVDTRRTFELLPKVPAGAAVVAESGFSRPEQLDELASAGVEAVLVGEALMRADNIELACRTLVGAPSQRGRVMDGARSRTSL